MKNYCIGLDIGTNSVGWAVVDEEQHLVEVEKGGKQVALWGVRLFDDAKKAEDRRAFRCARRRLERRRQRIDLLQQLFAQEIFAVDKNFFARLNSSRLWAEDRADGLGKFTLFDNVKDEKKFHKDYHTIYHLRRALCNNDEKADVRLLYLAIHHILKHRGHFLYENFSDSASGLASALENYFSSTCEDFDEAQKKDATEKLTCVFAENIANRNKQKKIAAILKQFFSADIANQSASAMVGLKFNANKLFDVDALEKDISFSSKDWEKESAEAEQALGSDFDTVILLKTVYDSVLLGGILDYCKDMTEGNVSISTAMVGRYTKHKTDLARLKKAVKASCTDEQYREFFVEPNNGVYDYKKVTYYQYVGHRSATAENYVEAKGKGTGKLSTDDFYKFIKTVLLKDATDSDSTYCLEEIEKGSFLPLQASKDNAAIPYQLHLSELEKILENQSKYYDFLKQGKPSVVEKILSIFTFRIPYYVGTLAPRTSKAVELSEKARIPWAVRRDGQHGKIYPWKFDDVIDTSASSVAFIERMTNKCSYLAGESVLPSKSPLFGEYCVLNELNKVRVNGEFLNVDQKEEIIDKLFKVKKTVTKKDLARFMKSFDNTSPVEISGVDDKFNASMSGYVTFRNILGDKVDVFPDAIENVALWATVLPDAKMLQERLTKEYADVFTDEEIKSLKGLKFSGWGRLSRKLLCEICGTYKKTGEVMTIMQALRATNFNLMQLVEGDEWTFDEEIAKCNAAYWAKDNVGDKIDALYCPCGIKRGVTQAVAITKEIEKVLKCKPQKIYLEVTRQEQDKTKTLSRKKQLLKKYNFVSQALKSQFAECLQELKARDEKTFNEKITLYFMQNGKCLYSGAKLDINSLAAYQVDHILPQSLVKDDSFENKALVLSRENQRKADCLTLKEDVIGKMTGFWKVLVDTDLMSQEKFRKLTRTHFSDEDIAGFINRQLVETNQTAKAVADYLRFDGYDVQFSKASLVTGYRHNHGLYKCRMLNDFHHAHDAYLNCLVWRAFVSSFGSDYTKFVRDKNVRAALSSGEKAISQEQKETYVQFALHDKLQPLLQEIKFNLFDTTQLPLVTRKTETGDGEFYNQTIQPKAKELIPVKTSVTALCDTARYGGYKSVNPAYFALFEVQTDKGKQLLIERILVKDINNLTTDTDFEKYVMSVREDVKDAKMLRVLPKYSHLKIDGVDFTLKGCSQNSVESYNPYQLICPKQLVSVFCYVERFVNGEKIDERRIDKDKLKNLFDMFVLKVNQKPYSLLPSYASAANNIAIARKNFEQADVETQILALKNIMPLFECNPFVASLGLISGKVDKDGKLDEKGSRIGQIKRSQFCRKVVVVNESVTGLYKKKEVYEAK